MPKYFTAPDNFFPWTSEFARIINSYTSWKKILNTFEQIQHNLEYTSSGKNPSFHILFRKHTFVKFCTFLLFKSWIKIYLSRFLNKSLFKSAVASKRTRNMEFPSSWLSLFVDFKIIFTSYSLPCHKNVQLFSIYTTVVSLPIKKLKDWYNFQVSIISSVIFWFVKKVQSLHKKNCSKIMSLAQKHCLIIQPSRPSILKPLANP